MKRHTLLAGFALAVAVVFCGCDGCGGSNPITIAITTAPPASMEVNQTASIAATVSNDGANGGVDWSCTPVGTCGTFTPAHTASAATTVYQAPPASANVVITAASTTKPAVTATANVTINPIGTTANLNGTYTFFANGWDTSSFGPISVAGSVVLDGAGHVTGGEQDWFDLGTIDDFATQDQITGGTVTVGNDGRGTLTLVTTSILNESFSITLVNNKHLLITQFDGTATSSGSLDLQTAHTSVPTGGNAFAMMDTWDVTAFGGVLTSDGTSTITTGEADADEQGTQEFDFEVTGSFTAPDAAGRGTIILQGLQFAYYVVGPKAFRLIEIDGFGSGLFLSGSMYGQGAGTFSAASLTGKFVFGQAGENDLGFGFYGAAGQFTTNGTTTLTAGAADVNESDGPSFLVTAGDLSGSAYFVNSNGYGGIALAAAQDTLANFGVYAVDPTLNIVDPNSASGGGGALMLDVDVDSLGTGIVVPQVSGGTFSGNYALSQDGIYVSSTAGSFFDIVGQVFSDGTSTLTGKADFNDINNTGQHANVTVTGTYAADGAHAGRATAQTTVNGAATPNHLAVYQASSALLLHVDVDETGDAVANVSVGVLEKQQ